MFGVIPLRLLWGCCWLQKSIHLPMPVRASEPVSQAFRYTHSYFSELQMRSINTLSSRRPRPSMEMRIPCSRRSLVKAKLGKPASLIGIENIRCAVFCQGFFRHRYAKVCVHGVGKLPRYYLATVPVHYGDKIQKASPHGNIRYIRAPHLIRPGDSQIPQQIRISSVVGVRSAGFGLLIDGHQAHEAHKTSHSLPANAISQ